MFLGLQAPDQMLRLEYPYHDKYIELLIQV